MINVVSIPFLTTDDTDARRRTGPPVNRRQLFICNICGQKQAELWLRRCDPWFAESPFLALGA
jgi:hypothetical protein